MTEHEAGKFCSSCSKSVVDFASLTDSEIVSLLEKNTGKICGRLSTGQIDRLFESDNVPRGSVLHKYLASLLLLVTTQASVAETKQALPNTEVRLSIDDNEKYPILQPDKPLTNDTVKNIIQGVVVDESNGEPIPFGSVIIKDTKIGTTTDFDGNFQLEIPDDLLTDKIYVQAMVVGFVNVQYEILQSDLPVTKLKFLMSPSHILMGEVVIIEKRKWWQRKRKNCP